ncbi:MAG: hypothetical protein JO069_03950 [Verrucomicrobia bacterium]|nr:hypothetical protein [Verrucomicrobiota bacterium]
MDRKRVILTAVSVSALCLLARPSQAQRAPDPAAGSDSVAQLPQPSPVPAADPSGGVAVSTTTGTVRRYQICRETQVTDAKVTRSDSLASVIQLSVDRDSVILHHGGTSIRYKVVGRRLVYQAANEDGSMQTSAPALVAARFDQGRVELLTVTPRRLTLLRPLEAMDGYVLTTAQFVGESPLSASSTRSRPQDQNQPSPDDTP